MDKRNRLISHPFSYQLTKEDKLIIFRDNKQIKIIKGKACIDFISFIEGADESSIQLKLAKLTGHYKHTSNKKTKTNE